MEQCLWCVKPLRSHSNPNDNTCIAFRNKHYVIDVGEFLCLWFNSDSPMINVVRGRGLFCAVVIKPHHGRDAMDVCMRLRWTS